ncbi:ribbon-helix-helix domain-containing protein [Candidatus Poriferisodalis sp.]|uniref:ribbon-helix-helix domain-containing protein n=1 Tax=Candidatus Poriferisodalis sp. TaxID=3101277 RepID=UPI003B01E59D
MKISVSIPDEDVETLDAYAQAHQLPSRSATIRQAIRLLRTSDLVLDYSTAFEEWSEADAALWDTAAGDGLETG